MTRKISRKGLVRKLDKIVSEIVRKRNPACVVCGATEGLQAGHLFSRRHYSTRWNLDNVWTQCSSCNFAHNQDAWPYTKWFIKKFGEKKLEELHELYKQVTKWNDIELEELYGVLETLVRSS